MTEQKITRDLTIEEIFKRFPSKSQKLAQELTNAGLHCAGCAAATWETLESGFYSHGMTDEEIEKIIHKLNLILEEKEEENPDTITMTEKAAKKYLEILEEEGKKGWHLRLGDKPAGCNGFEYVLDFSEKAKDTDEIFESKGFEIHVDKNQISRLLGCIIDYVDGLQGAGFKISNPNVRSSCGCGSSHGY